jgi:putative transferase (TIGR04331 family)
MEKIKSNNNKNTNKKLRKKILIISNLKKKNALPHSSTIYLNEGCLPFSLIENNFCRKLLPNYPHLKKDKIKKNYFYLLGVYDFFLKTVSCKLNKIHNVNYSKKYWRVVIGFWLFEFISIIFDNWKRLKYISTNYNLNYVEVAKFKSLKLFFKNHNDFSDKSTTDIFNNVIYEDLLKLFKNIKVKYFYDNKKYFNNNVSYRSVFGILANNIKKIFIFFNNFLKKNNNSVIHNPYFSKKISFLLQIKLKQIPNFYKSPNINIGLLNNKIRSETINHSKDPFSKVVSKLLFKYMPLSYLENYPRYINEAKNINWPQKPKFIFSSNSFFIDDFFKIWLAEKKEKFKTKFISGQHGGLFFTSKFDFYQKHQAEVSDLILTWGYNKKKYKSVFNFKTTGKKIKFKKDGNLLFIHYAFSKFSSLHSIYTGFSYSEYLKDQFNFIKRLDSRVRDCLVYRKYPYDFAWNNDLKSSLKNNIKLDLIEDKNKNLYDSLSKSRICFVNLNSTVYLETLNLNFPTILFFNNRNMPINQKTKKYFDILKKAGIYFDDYEMAAKKINQIWDNVDNWWYNKSVQKAVNIFCDKFSKRSLKNPIKKLYNSLSN